VDLARRVQAPHVPVERAGGGVVQLLRSALVRREADEEPLVRRHARHSTLQIERSSS
jgi:hypothetical protein